MWTICRLWFQRIYKWNTLWTCSVGRKIFWSSQ